MIWYDFHNNWHVVVDGSQVPIAILYAILIESPLHALNHPTILKIVPIILKSFQNAKWAYTIPKIMLAYCAHPCM